MGYYDSQETIIIVTQRWKLHVPSRRYFNQAVKEVKSRLAPERSCIWKPSKNKFNGYQADLVSFSIDPAPDSALDSALSSGYPDW